MIGAAIGILMARGAQRDEAFAELRAASQHLNIQLREITGTVAQPGQLPDTAR